MTAPRNWSQIASPIHSLPPPTQPSRPRSPPQPQSQASNNRTRNRKNRKKRHKQSAKQWPTLNNQKPTNTSSHKNKANNKVSFASLTSKTQKFASTSNPYDTLSISSASSINKKELYKLEELRRSALNTLSQQWNTSRSVTIYGVRNRGICNRNVDCYINAIIQSLLSLPLLLSILSSIKYATNIGPFTRALYDTIHLFSISSHNGSSRNSFNHPPCLIFILDKFRDSQGRMGNGQQDAEEFLGYILANLHDEMTWKKTKESNEIAIDNGWKLVTKNVHHKASIAHKLAINESLISMLFCGEYYQMIRIKKRKASVSYEPFFSISLDINDNKIASVSSALQNHLGKPNIIEYKKGFGKKTEFISESPYYLILHLKRFLFENGEIYKLNKYIAYDTKLTIAPHLLFDKTVMKTGNINKLRYELRSVIVHEGDFVSHGHYLSFCRREDFYMNKINKNRKHQWIMFNDDKVKGCIDVNTVKQQQAYVLIYQKIV